ncbi:polyprenol monophosphomannose synthase [Phaeocystidibacter marisrubri]|uniref:Polyprenol monophosphomannose synthase n=1 Tax=Phaeocystidibacter marisrubri TaxID=1577780 RepID=A0A6L3ZGY3_9FLAO|nr:polyprenol monophosphomannose synthase [Phaeocystidibacter marisrubri]KAB2816209.1 polyprenol monophosphomannose synthase [Phaeocystidibacter marisrubri]GGH67868.1 dolichol-phosphate mannosyltransferase [Phaeocystidibacter marisrubri]
MAESVVIIPTYNERENIENILHAVLDQQYDFHVLIVDDASPDGTADIVKSIQKSYPDRLHIEERSGKQGLGTAYIHGFRWALEREYEFVFEMDADFSHDPNDLINLKNACTDGADLSIGSRYVRGVNVVNWPMSRVLLSFFASKYVRFVTGIPVHDTTAGFICYRRSVLERIKLDKIKFVGYAFQIEMKFKAWKHGFTVREVPVIFTDRTAGQSKMSNGIIKEAIFGVIRLKLDSIFNRNY